MAKRYRRRSNSGGFGLLLLVGLGYVAIKQNPIAPETLHKAFTIGGVVLAVVLGLIIIGAVAKHRETRALKMSNVDTMDGVEFEHYVAKLLKGQGYARIRLTERFDLGVDVIAEKNGIRWGVQVKRNHKPVKAAAVRQVVTALNKYKCQKAMVVSNSTYSRPARELAASNNCVLIGRDELAGWIVQFQKG